MSLAKYLAQAMAEHGPAAIEMAKKYRGALGAGAGLAAAGAGAMAAKPMIDDYAANAALHKVTNQAKEALGDTVDFAQDHPYVTGAALGGSGLLGGIMGGDDYTTSLGDLLGRPTMRSAGQHARRKKK